jgi:hypothetical protein
VKYSAGILDYFFRGTFTMSVSWDSNSQLYNFGVTNTSGQDFNGGNFFLLEDNNGVRSIVQTVPLTGILTNGTGMSFTLGGPATDQFLLFYQGTIGVTNGSALDPVDENIAIAVGVNSVWHSSFETDAGNENFTAGEELPEGWVVDFGDIDLTPGFVAHTAYEGNWFVDLNGWNAGGISTDIVLVPGQTYRLNFAYARNPDSIIGYYGYPAVVPQAEVLIDGNAVGTVAANGNDSWANLDWHTKSYVFTANSSLTHLAFHSVDTAGASGVLIDAINVAHGTNNAMLPP